ncbi:MAG: 4Fe-4S binding protein [Fibromonadaceae bacterium]|jgi:ferredoxin|nr:4Fe-4S binding protein [Fibromonadaceae bacterium]
MRNVSYCVKNNLCTSCGICEDVCSKNAIKISQRNFMPAPIVDKKKYNDCGLCCFDYREKLSLKFVIRILAYKWQRLVA